MTREKLGIGSITLVIALSIIMATFFKSALVPLGIISSISSDKLSNISSYLPFGYAFGAGMIACVNPCGFALLPGFLGLYLKDSKSPLKALKVGTGVSITFVFVFGIVGLGVLALGAILNGVIHYASIIMAFLLIILGGYILSGNNLDLNLEKYLPTQIAHKVFKDGFLAYITYGFVYAVSSLGCTLPIFLAVLTIGINAGIKGIILSVVAYALGMGLVFTLIALVLNSKTLRRRNLGFIQKHFTSIAAVILLATGGYLAFYQLSNFF